MKKTLQIVLVLFFFATLSSCVREFRCCGKIKELYREQTQSGYIPHVVFYCDSLKRSVDVSVSNNTYVNLKLEQNVCFILNEHDLSR